MGPHTLSPPPSSLPACPPASWSPGRVFPLHHASSHSTPSLREFDSHPTDLFVTSSLTMCKSACLFLIYLPPSDFTSQLVSWASPSGDPAVITQLSCYNQALSCSPPPKSRLVPAPSPLPRGPGRQPIFLMVLTFFSCCPAGTEAQLMLYNVIPPPCVSPGESYALTPGCRVSWFPSPTPEHPVCCCHPSPGPG